MRERHPVSPVGIGIDVVDVARVERLIRRHGARALGRLLTEEERAYCQARGEPARHVAVRLAAKEAAFKAFQSAGAASSLGWREIEVRRRSGGLPELVWHARARILAQQLEVSRALLSLSHSHAQAVAVVLLLAK